MKLRSRQFAAAVSAAALIGISITTAYSAPNYVPPANSPLDTTSLNSESALLDAFNGYLDNIQAALPLGVTLRKPDLGGATAPTDVQFYAAVSAAVAADTVHAYEIVAAAVQWRGSKHKDIVKSVATAVPAAAPDAVAAVAAASPANAGNAAAGAILGLLVNGTPAELADAADDAVIAATRDLIEKVAKTAVAATKASGSQNTAAGAVATAIVDAVLADAATSNAELYFDDLFRGVVGGAANFTQTNQSVLAAVALSRFSTAPALATKENLANAAMGALKGTKILTGPDGYDDTSTALIAAANAIDGTAGAVIAAGSKAQKVLRTALATTEDATFSSNLTAIEAADEFLLYGYMSGAVQALKGRAGIFVKLALEDTDVGVLSVAKQKAVIAAAITGNFGATSRAILNGVTADTNRLTAVDAVTAAIPAASDLFSGVATSAAMKNNPVTTTAGQQAVLAAAINTAESAGYNRALADIALSGAKAAKLIDNELVTTAIAEVPAGWEAAVAAAIISNNAKESTYTGPPTLGSNEAAAIAAAVAKGANVAAVQVAMNVAQGGKLSGKTLYDDAIEALYTPDGSANPDAVLVGAGIVNKKFQVPLLGAALRLNTGTVTGAQLLNYAISVDKKKKTNAELGYEAAVDSINSPDNIFDMVDHKVLSYPKNSVDIISGVVGARPEYAHFAARAASYRAAGSAGKIGSAAITYGHMRANRTNSGAIVANPDDPAAVAAISAAVVLGVLDANLVTVKEEAAIKSAVGSMVKASLAFQNPLLDKTDLSKKAGLIGSTKTFQEATGNGDDPFAAANFVLSYSKGTAAAITGAVANLQGDGDTTLSALARVAIAAAAKAAKLHGLAIAQAAGAAAAAAATLGPNSVTFTDFAGIAAAFTGTGVISTAIQLENAARLGAKQFEAGIFGAGAAGILNYAHHSGNTPPVTDLSNF